MTVSRIATENDRLAILKLAAQMHLETDFRFYNFDPGVAIAGLSDWLGDDPRSVMFVAEADGEVVGMLGAEVLTPPFREITALAASTARWHNWRTRTAESGGRWEV